MAERQRERTGYSPRGSLVLSALDVLPDASIIVFDTDLVFVVARGEALHDAGLEPSSLEERRVSEALSASRWAFYEPFYRAALAGQSSSVEVGSVADDGRRYVVNVGPVRDSHGAVIGGVAVATDVSDHLRLRAALEESESRFRLLAENSSDVVLRIDDDWDIGWVSPSVHDVLGYTTDEVLGTELRDYLVPDSRRQIEAAYLAWDRVGPLRDLLLLRAADSGTRWVEVTACSMTPEGASTVMTVVNLRDVDARVRVQQALADSEEQFRLTMEQAAVGMALVDAEGGFLVVNPALERLLGYQPGELVGQSFLDVTHPDDLESGVHLHRSLVDGEVGAMSVRKRYLRKDGDDVWADLSVAAVRDSEGRFRHNVAQMTDATVEVEALRKLARSEERFRLAMTAAPVGMAISDPEGRFVQVNDALCSLLGLDEAELLGSTVGGFLAPGEEGLIEHVSVALAQPGASTFRHQHRLVSPTRSLWVEHSASVLRDETGAPVFYVHQFADHTEAHELRQDLEYRASHDALTGVVNRGELMTQLAHSLRRGQGGAGWLGVLFCDIDNLKPLNDEYGHHTGDVAIQIVAERLRSAVRSQDLVARIGGDEFVVLLEGLHSREQLAAIAEKCRATVQGPVPDQGHSIEVSVSVGAVLAGQDESADEVLARADHALHRAKVGGRRQIDVD
jgi:diguanylate cyclase (GGDEF)-like protein/PAS domain S-box-containing protein